MADFEFNNYEFGKTKRTKRFHRLRLVVRIFRYLELFAAMALFTWLSSRAPVFFRASGEYIRWICAIVVSPLFGFILGNAIIIAIFVKAGLLSRYTEEDLENEEENVENEIFEESCSELPRDFPEKKAEFHDKEIVCDDEPEIKAVEEEAIVPDPEPRSVLTYRRSESSKITPVGPRNEIVSMTGKVVNMEYPEDDLTSDEFRRTIDDFITRQLRFIRGESSSA